MNATEHIVEVYFRQCRKCFTTTDVKVKNGWGRQFDLLAVSVIDGSQYHVETTVTLDPSWAYHTKHLAETFDKKFRGVTAKDAGNGAESSNGKCYESEIHETYKAFGLTPEKVQRVWCGWIVADDSNLNQFLTDYKQKTGIGVAVLSFRDEVIPKLQATVATSNYDDEVLRTLSLLKQREVEVQAK